MKLEQLLAFERIAIQCHDNPDADAIAAGFGLHAYFKAKGKDVVFFYSGRNAIAKPNLVKMLHLLQIPLEHRPQPAAWQGLLVTVDCQYGAGNVTKVAADQVAVIDHHIQECTPPALHDIRPYLGSCSTLVWKLLEDAGFSIDLPLSTALYYGLFSDTNGFSEVSHPLDRDLRDFLAVNERVIKTLKNSNLSIDDLALASAALKDLNYHEKEHFALISVRPCDPNILGFVSDLAMQVDGVDMAVVYSEVSGGIKFSVRTVVRESRASDIAVWLTANGLGSGGGHAEKAGGYISAQNFTEHCPGMTPVQYFEMRLRQYLKAYTIIDCNDAASYAHIDTGSMQIFEKLPLRLAYVRCAEVFPDQTNLHIRMPEGDISLKATADTYLMIGRQGEVYPIERQKFHATYADVEGPVLMEFSYTPAVLDRDRGTRVPLDTIAKACVSIGGGVVKAAPLHGGIKLFTRWDTDNYVKGEVGDWLVMRDDDTTDLYIITGEVFHRLYRSL